MALKFRKSRKLRMQRRHRASSLRIGEIVRVRSAFGLPPEGIFRVEEVGESMVKLSAGEIVVGLAHDGMKVLARDLPEPESWLAVEIELLRAQVAVCDCSDCRTLLANKERALEAMGFVGDATIQ